MGFECGDGWFQLLFELCDALKSMGLERSVDQIKSMGGGLKFYVVDEETLEDKFMGMIIEGERASFKVCEICGNAGLQQVSLHDITTLCPKHFEIQSKIEEHEKT